MFRQTGSLVLLIMSGFRGPAEPGKEAPLGSFAAGPSRDGPRAFYCAVFAAPTGEKSKSWLTNTRTGLPCGTFTVGAMD